MGLMNGRIACRRYERVGVPREDPFDACVSPLIFAGFGDEEKIKAAGWVPLLDWFGKEVTEEGCHLQSGSFALTLRQDTRRVPTHFFRQECRLLAVEWRLRAGREDLTRAEREEIKVLVQKRLLARALPNTLGVDVVHVGPIVYVLSAGEAVNDTVRSLWERTFGDKLLALTPPTLLRSEGLKGTEHEGSDFLLWLWYRSECLGEIDLSIEDKIAFADPETGKQLIVVKRGLVSETAEARAARAAGKRVTELRFLLNGTHTATLKAETFGLTGIRLPTVAADDSDDWRSTALVRLGHLQDLWETLDRWWAEFVALKSGEGWSSVATEMAPWAQEGRAP